MTRLAGQHSLLFSRLIPITLWSIFFSISVLLSKPELAADFPLPFDLPFALSQLEDGTFRGTCTIREKKFTVEVVVKARAIIAIHIIDGPQRIFVQKCGLCNATEIIKKIIDNQAVPVDAYSGATTTTRAVLGAVETALLHPFEGSEETPTDIEAWK